MNTVDEFVVEVDRDAVLRARATMVRTHTLSGWISLVGAGFLAAMVVVLVELAGVVGLLNLMPAGLIGLNGARMLRRAGRLRVVWAAQGVAPVAMRVSPAGLRVSIDAAPDSIFLPWPVVQGFRMDRRLGQQVLVLDLMPGVTSATPGVTGLDHPDVQRVLQHKVHGTKGIRFAVQVLRQRPAAIDQALAECTDGRVRIR